MNNIVESKNTARRILSTKFGNAFCITILYTIVIVALDFVIGKINTINISALRTILNLLLQILEIFFGYGLISSLIKLSNENKDIPYTEFITEGIQNAPKILEILIRLFLKLLLPVIGGSFIFTLSIYANIINKYLGVLVLLLSLVFIIYFALNYVFTLFYFIDNKDKPVKDSIEQSKKLIARKQIQIY